MSLKSSIIDALVKFCPKPNIKMFYIFCSDCVISSIDLYRSMGFDKGYKFTYSVGSNRLLQVIPLVIKLDRFTDYLLNNLKK